MNKVFIVTYFLNEHLETFKVREKLYRFKYYDDAFDSAVKMLKDKKAERSYVYEITEDKYQALIKEENIGRDDLQGEHYIAEFNAYKKYPNPRLKEC